MRGREGWSGGRRENRHKTGREGNYNGKEEKENSNEQESFVVS